LTHVVLAPRAFLDPAKQPRQLRHAPYLPNADDRLPASVFYNQNAVYYPDGDYSALYDSISGVNQFRVVLNKMFGQKLPLLRDSVIFLRDSP
jgi:hypothetical protein